MKRTQTLHNQSGNQTLTVTTDGSGIVSGSSQITDGSGIVSSSGSLLKVQ